MTLSPDITPALLAKLLAALAHIRLECEAAHSGQEQTTDWVLYCAHEALSRIDEIARKALADA